MQATTSQAVDRVRKALLALDDDLLLFLIKLWKERVPKFHWFIPRWMQDVATIRSHIQSARDFHFVVLGHGGSLRALHLTRPKRDAPGNTHADTMNQIADLCEDRTGALEKQFEIISAELRLKQEQQQAARLAEEQARKQRIAEQAAAAARAAVIAEQQREARDKALIECRAGAQVKTDGGHEISYDAVTAQFSCSHCTKTWRRMPNWATSCAGPPRPIRDRSQPPPYCYRSTLKERYGLTDSWIRRLGPPDQYVDNPHYRHGPQASLYLVSRVEAFIAENREEYDIYRAKREQRRPFVHQSAVRAARTRQANREEEEAMLVRDYEEDLRQSELYHFEALRNRRAAALQRICTPEHIEASLQVLVYLNRWAKAKDALLYADRQGLYELKTDILKQAYQAHLLAPVTYIKDETPFEPWANLGGWSIPPAIQSELTNLENQARLQRQAISIRDIEKIDLCPEDFDLSSFRDQLPYETWSEVPESELAFLDPEYFSLIAFQYESSTARFVFHMPLRIAQKFLPGDIVQGLMANPGASREVGELFGRPVNELERQQQPLPYLFDRLDMPLEFYCPHKGEDKQAYIRRKEQQRRRWDHNDWDDDWHDDWD